MTRGPATTPPPTTPSPEGQGEGTAGPRRRKRPARTAVLVLCGIGVAVAGGVAGGGIVRLTDRAAGTAAGSSACNGTSVADAVVPSVVTLSVQGPVADGSGSGELVRTGGYVLTNDHVISAAATDGRIEVIFSDGSTEPATIVGRSPALDLAVVKVADAGNRPVIRVGDSEGLRVGQPVVAIGAPLGLSGTVTSGIVSALGRDVVLPAEVAGSTTTLPGTIQTDASINPGNSGGALVDCRSRLVGINTAISTVPNEAGQVGGGSVGIGFAIPVALAQTVADQLIAKGRFDPPYVGVTTVPVSTAAKPGSTDGLLVRSVTAGGPAAVAGLRSGDIITHVDDRPVTGPDSLVLQTLRGRPDAALTIGYDRDGRTATTTVTVAAQP